ncbi:MAG: hypothetical protein HYX59_10265, partial [Elusimicrobia bacterium]|nr:hypothetical protein [Elusimicrobiota bacterium]
MKTNSRPMRITATLLALALIHGAFAPEAWAQVVSIGAVNAPVGGSAAAAAGSVSSPVNSAAPSLSLSNAGLTATFSAPAIAPAPAHAALAVNASVPAAAAPAALSARTSAVVPAALAPSAVPAASKESAPKTGEVAAAQAPASETAPVTLQAGPRTGRIASKAASIISGVRAFFGGKSVETVPAAKEAIVSGKLSAAHASELEPANETPAVRPQSGVNEPPAPQQPNEPGKKGKGWFGLGATVAALIGGMLTMQLGLEAQGAAMAQLTEDAFGDFSILAQVAIFASIGSMVGQQLAKFFSDRFGLTKTFYAAHVFRAVSLATMVMLLGTGHMALPLMFVFYALNGMVTGIAATAQGTLQKFLLAEQGVSQQKFRTWWQFLAEVFGVLAPMVLGALVVSVGAGWITAIYPATIILALMLFLMLKVIPLSTAKRIENKIADAAKAASAVPDAKPEPLKSSAWEKVKNAFKQIFNNMEEG